MNNPIQIFNNILSSYLKYINSGLPFFRDEYNQERDALLKESGTICQPPIIEIVPKYREKATLSQFCVSENVTNDINDFVNTGLFVNDAQQERRLYDHQYEALKEAHCNRKHIVITTGTGSGKTECFLLPIIADLVIESKTWNIDRPRAMRTMILYPLNALAEDQMIRLRKALNSRRPDNGGALDWLDLRRNGHRFYFGRYTGATPTSGIKDKVQAKLREEKKQLQEDWKAAKEAALDTGNSELLYHVPCMDNDSAEMWDRFSMQDNAPDILITNYSMLNVMLMRENETCIFEDTKAWLQADKRNVFHLVIDELHSYRGTAGTEVAYLLRVLLDRIGLAPDSPQIQFLASSASMEENQQSIDFLSEFFGVDKATFRDHFKIISNPPQPSVERPQNELPKDILADYSQNKNEDADIVLLEKLHCNTMLDVTEKYGLLNWLRYSLSTNRGIKAKDVVKIADTICPNSENGLDVVAAIIEIICKSETSNGYIAPIRAHFFFRNITGLWGCSDPDCSHVDTRYAFEGRYVGALYKRPRNICSCGMRVLDVLVCENCGEIFLGGYKFVNDGRTFLTIETPFIEGNSPYCVLYKYNDEVKDGWVKVSFNPASGEFKKNIDGDYILYEQVSGSETRLPNECPQCGVEYKIKDKNSLTPIRAHSAGLQKVNQILADALIRSMKNAKEKNTKVVLFSDSRQSAAKLSAGIELDHYRDVLRWAILHALNGSNEIVSFFKKLRSNLDWSKDDGNFITQMTSDPIYGNIAQLLLAEKMNWGTEEDKVKLDAFFMCSKGLRLGNIENEVFKTLLSLGMNPAGPKPSVSSNMIAGQWHSLFDFDTMKIKSDLSDNKLAFCDRIRRSNKLEQMSSIFSNRKRSFEELKLGYLTPSVSIDNPTIHELVCSIVRILGEKKRIKDFPSQYPATDSFPLAVTRLIKKVYHISSRTAVNEKKDFLKEFLRKNGIIDSRVIALTGEGLSFVKADIGSKYWECPRCKTIHMQPSNGICISCFHSLLNYKTLTKEDIMNPNDYYLNLLNSTENVYRLHCEEMTGQTSKQDSKKRQRLFQDIFLKSENPVVDGIDLLSVTTTMEAGVDIGSLSAVMMGNVPPQRFNYQQRVGRAGRRGAPLSVALTVARSVSHDLTNFHEYERMVSDTPKDPYLEVRTKEIAERIIYKEILYQAINKNAGASDNVHGNFGTVEEWKRNKSIVEKWLNDNKTEVSRIIQFVTCGTEITSVQKYEIEDYIYNGLLEKITEIAQSNEFSQLYLSERLANAGLMPMFGFPTRTRNLYLSMPKKIPAEDVVSRDVDMALNSFAPGHEIVKDKKVYRAVGIVDYEYDKSHVIRPKKNSLNCYKLPLNRCKNCGYSTISQNDRANDCPVCKNVMQQVNICSPLGFCVDYDMPIEDFNGIYDWYSPNSDIKLDCEHSLSDCPKVKNMCIRNNILPSQGLVHLVNDNNGAFYKLGMNKAGVYVSRDAYPEEMRNNLQLSYETKYAFVSSKTTGVLALSIADENENVCLSPLNDINANSYAVRAAFMSWGYLVRKAISDFLDIDSSELNVGFYITPKTKKSEIFFVETLENGAGYCNYLSGRKYSDIPQKAIVNPLIKGGGIYDQLTSTSHNNGCISSCYDCIRDYSNQSEHALLDWRLGLDIARLANDCNATIDFSVDYWNVYIEVNVKNFLLKHGYEIKKYKNTLIGIDSFGDKFILTHPLWSNKYTNELKIGLNDSYKSLSVFGLIRNYPLPLSKRGF